MINFKLKHKYMNQLSPFVYSIFMFLAIPMAILIFIIVACLLLIFWPILPIAAYFQRKQMADCNYINNDYE